jgi:hypothetical protein
MDASFNLPFTVRSGTTGVRHRTMAEFISARSRQETSPLSSPHANGPPGRATNHHACSREIVACDTP